MEEIDVLIVGAGVVGLAVAREIAQHGHTTFAVEKHETFGTETSSRNSEVIHAGIYYPSGTLKARMCVEGKELLYAYCQLYSIPHKRIGKLIVAQNNAECSHLEKLHAQGMANGVTDLYMIDQRTLRSMEPYIAGMTALVSPSTGIFDTHRFMHSLYHQALERGAAIVCNTEFMSAHKIPGGFDVICRDSTGEEVRLRTRVLINCAGLYSDDVARRTGMDIEKNNYTLHYCKGEYFRIMASKRTYIHHLVYPVPDAVSLGVHLTPDLSGGVRIGPNAEYIARTNVDYAVDETKRDDFYDSARHLFPLLERDDISPDTAGIRPKLQGPHDAVRDFVICHEIEKGLAGFINLVGIESPGLTASLAIARSVYEYAQPLLFP